MWTSANGTQLKRQHSAEPLSDAAMTRKSPHMKDSDSPAGATTPKSINSVTAHAGTPPLEAASLGAPNDVAEVIGSPHKKQRPSLPGFDESAYASLGPPANAISKTPQLQSTVFQANNPLKVDEDEEL